MAVALIDWFQVSVDLSCGTVPGVWCALTPGYGAGVQLVFFVVTFTTKKADGTKVAHEPLVRHLMVVSNHTKGFRDLFYCVHPSQIHPYFGENRVSIKVELGRPHILEGT